MADQTREDFEKAWKTRFPDDKVPPLDCFDEVCHNTQKFVSACQQQYDSTRHNLEMLQKEVHQQEFIASFLFDVIRNPPLITPTLDSEIPVPSVDEPVYHGYASVDVVGPKSSRISSRSPSQNPKPDKSSDATANPVVAPPGEHPLPSPLSDKEVSGVGDSELGLTKQYSGKTKKKSSSKSKSKSSRTKGSKKVKEKGSVKESHSLDSSLVEEESSEREAALAGGDPPVVKTSQKRRDFAEFGKSQSLEDVLKGDNDAASGRIFRTNSNPNVLEEVPTSAKPVPAPRASAFGPTFKLKTPAMEEPVVRQPSFPTDGNKSDLSRSQTGSSQKKIGPPPPAKPIRTSSLESSNILKQDTKANTPTSVPEKSPTSLTNVDRVPTIEKIRRRKPMNTYETIELDDERESWHSAQDTVSIGSNDSTSGQPPSRAVGSVKSSPAIAPKPSTKRDASSAKSASTERIYDEAFPVKRESIDEASSSDDEEPIYFNIMLMKQKTLQSHQMFASVDIVERPKQTLENKARGLTKRFSRSVDTSLGLPNIRPPAALPITETDLDNVPNTVETQAGIFGGDGTDGGLWKRRGSMQMATDGDSVSEDDGTPHINVVVPLGVEGEKTQTRKLLVTSILDSEHAYVASLDILMQYMQTFKNVAETPHCVITPDDIKVIFYKIPDLHQIHCKFIRELEPKVQNWSSDQEIAENFKMLALAEYPVATDYLANYHKAVERIRKCTSENQRFRELTQDIKYKGVTETPNLEELVHKPVVRFQRNSLVLHDLIACTPATHSDYDLLQKTLRIAQNFLENFQNPKGSTADNQRYLAKQGLIVEKTGNTRKLRHVFLFNDILVCSKQKLSKQKIHYEIKWYIPLADLSIDDNSSTLDDKKGDKDNQGLENLRRKVSELQGDLHEENKKARQSAEPQKNWSLMGHNSRVEKIKKKLMEQEVQLVLTSPQLVLRLRNKRIDKAYTFLMSSDYERVNWYETIDALQTKAVTGLQLSAAELQNIVNSEKLPKFQAFGDDLGLEEELLYGSLIVKIHKLQGLSIDSDVFCIIEVDTFNHFFTQAKTNAVPCSSGPVWNEDFDIDLEGTQTLRILCYKLANGTELLVGKCALELSKAWLRGDFVEESVFLSKELSLIVSMRYVSRDITLKRTPSAAKTGLFGVKISITSKREGTKIPVIVSACAKEIEARGISDIGIYRISGVSAEIQRLKKAFEKNSRGAAEHAKDVDVNVLTGLLKLYFRELPEALFTDTLYPSFIKGMSLNDQEAKEKFMLSLIYQLPEPNKSTVYFMLDHLVRIAEKAEVNKMSLHNLATVFGPTLLRPAIKDTESLSMDQLFSLGAKDAMVQTGILLYFLSLRQKGVDFNSGRAYVTRF